MDTTMPDLSELDELDKDLSAGQRVGEYVIEGRLGAGGFGTVFRASHPVIGKLVAIKVLNRQFSVQREMVSRFVAEARAVNQIRHRNIIDIFGFGTLDDGRHYYVMELLDGTTLGEHLERVRRLPLREALPILRAVGKALDAAHAKGIAHRDLKPENIFLAVDPDGGFFPKLLDFGIAKLLVGDDPAKSTNHKTRTGAPIGTPLYMSPEQCRGRDVDHRTDIYAFGIVAFRMLTGKLPFDAEDYMSILMQQMSDPPPPPSSLVAELPAGIDRAITWMLAKEPAARPASLMKAMEALEHAAAEAGVESPTWNSTPPVGSLGRPGGGRAVSETGETLPASSLRGVLALEGGHDGGRELGSAATLNSAEMTVPAISGARNTTPDVVVPEHARPAPRGKWLAVAAAGLVAAAAVMFVLVRRGPESEAESQAESQSDSRPDDRTETGTGARPAGTTMGTTTATAAPAAATATKPAAPTTQAPATATEPEAPGRPGGALPDVAGVLDAIDAIAPAAPPDTVKLTFTGLPDDAVVYGKGHRALGLAREGIVVARSAEELSLTFEVEGRVLARKRLRPEADAEIAVEVARAGRPRPTGRDRPAPGPAAKDPDSTERPPGL